MAKQKQQAIHKVNEINNVSVIIPLHEKITPKQTNALLATIKEGEQKKVEYLLLVSQEQDKAFEKELQEVSQKPFIQYIKSNTSSKPGLISQGISSAEYQYILVIDPVQLTHPIYLNDIINNITGNTEDIIRLRYTPKCELHFCKKNVAEYLYAHLNIKNNNYVKEVWYKTKRLPLKNKIIEINKSYPLEKHKNPFLHKIIYNILLFFTWFFIDPIKDIKNKKRSQYAFLKEPSIYRFIFASIALVLFFLMPIMSLNSSISGDEYVQYKQAKNYYEFYASGGKDTTYMSMQPAYAYGMSFDLVSYAINKWFNVENVYRSRHILNALCGWIAIVFAGLLAFLLGGWRTGIITMLLMFFTPRFLGHSFNNPKDIPFAAAYIFTIYYIIKFLKKYPDFSIRNWIAIPIGIGAAISIRIGGLLLIAYLFFFAGMYYLNLTKIKSFFAAINRKTLSNLLFHFIIISFIGYFLGLILWPYGLTNPVKHPLNSLEIMTHFTTSLRQLFEGNIYWSDYLPWYYIPKYILITTPFVILIGFLLYFVFIRKKIIQSEYLYSFFLVFSFAFPVFYIIYKGSNVYGGWRHALFIWPTFVIATSLGYEKLLRIIRNKRFQYLIYGIMAALALKPAIHIIKHHPYEYIYFNKFVGGVDRAYGDYEMDYYGHSLKPAAKWLINNIIEDKLDEIDPNDKMIIRTNFTRELRHYMRKYNNKVKVHYCRYYERGNFDWDYAIFVNTYLNPYQQKHGIWPPGKTIHTINIDDAIICAVQERKTTLDLKGFQALQNNNPQQAIINLKKAIKITPHNEAAYINLCRAYLKIGMHNQAIKTAYKCLKFYPDYDQVLNLLGIAYLQKNELNNALATFNKLKKVNKKYSSAYYYMGIIYMRQSQPYNAMKYLKQCIESNQQYKPAYYAMAEILKKLGKPEQAKQYLQVANSF